MSAPDGKSMPALLARLKEWRAADPAFEKAFNDIAQAETAHAKHDPAEGRAFRNAPKPEKK